MTEKEKLLSKAIDIINRDCEKQLKFERRMSHLDEDGLDYYEMYDFLQRTYNQYDAIIESRVTFVCAVFDLEAEEVWKLIREL